MNNFFLVEAGCWETGEVSHLLNSVFTQALCNCSSTHTHADLSSINVTSRKTVEERRQWWEFGGHRLLLTCREWTGPHDLKKQRKFVALDKFYDSFTNIQYVSVRITCKGNDVQYLHKYVIFIMYDKHDVRPEDMCTVMHNSSVHYCTCHMWSHKSFSRNKAQSSVKLKTPAGTQFKA